MSPEDLERRERALAYRNPAVIHRFRKLYDIDEAEAEELFVETLKLIWLMAEAGRVALHPEMLILDEMWHNFILFTRDYRDYCRDHVGRFVEHFPSTPAEEEEARARFESDPEGYKNEHVEQYEEQLGITADLLGEETVVRWHVDYRNRYSSEFFATRRKPVDALAPIADPLAD